MQNKRYDRIERNADWWKLSVTPENVFAIDKDKEFWNFVHLSDYLDMVIQSKSDLIALLHFSDLKAIKSHLFFALSGIDTDNLVNSSPDNKVNIADAVHNIKDKMLREQVRDHFWIEQWGGPILRAHAQRKKEFPINFDDFLFEHHGVYDERLASRNIPQTEFEQKEFLSQLIDQWFFDIQNSYKHRDRLMQQIISSMWFFLHWSSWSTYPKTYTKRIIMEWYTRWKLSDYCLWSLLKLRLEDRTTYAENILNYIEELRPHPELIKRILACIEVYFTKVNT